MNPKNAKPRWFFYPLWIILTSLCVPLAFIIDLAILKIIIRFVGDMLEVNGVPHITEDYLYMFIFIPLIGLLTGVIQYVLLRPFLPRIGWWVFATLAGWLLGLLLAVVSGRIFWSAGSMSLDTVFLLMGLAIGVAQWLLLRPRLPRAGWWIAANVLGWGVLALITPGNALNQYALFTVGFIPACFTAAGLAALMVAGKPAQPQDALMLGMNLL